MAIGTIDKKISCKATSSGWNLVWLFYVFLSLFRIAITYNLYTEVDTIQKYDDMLFSKLAFYICQTGWLGPYDSLTLIKGPVFPLFLAAVHWSHLPYLVILATLHVLCVGYLLYCCRNYLKNRWLWLLLGAILLFDPMEVAGRLLRNSLYMSLTCVFLGVLLESFWPRPRGIVILRVFEYIFIAICFGMAWYIREEIFILKVVVGLYIVCLAYCFKMKKMVSYKKTLYGLIGVFVFYMVISIANYIHYGKFTTIETITNPYSSAYETLTSITDPANRLGIVISSEKIHHLAQYSPSIYAVEKCMTQGEIFDKWRSGSPEFNLSDMRWYANPEKTYVSGVFIEWQLRQCLENANYYIDAQTSENYYKNLKNELDEAIKLKKIKLAPLRFSFGSFFIDIQDWQVLLRGFVKGLCDSIFAEKSFYSIETSGSEVDNDTIEYHKKFFKLHTWNKNQGMHPTNLTLLSYLAWEWIEVCYNKTIPALYACSFVLFFVFIFRYNPSYESPILCCCFVCYGFFMTRYLALVAIQIHGFWAVVPSYFSSGYIALSVSSVVLLDNFASRVAAKTQRINA